MPKKKTQKQFEQEIAELTDSSYIVIGTYVNALTPIELKHSKCNNSFHIIPNNFLRQQPCPFCQRKNAKSHEQFIKDLNDINTNIKVLGKYNNKRTKIKCKCAIDEFEWDALPSNLLSGRGCPCCNGGLIMSDNEFKDKLLSVHGKRITSIEQYKGSHAKILFKCNVCGHKWKATPHNVITSNKCGCPLCSASKGELLISKILTSKSIAYEYQKTFDDLIGVNGGLLSYDFFIPQLNLLIEYQGIQHEIPIDFLGRGAESANKVFIKQKKHDKLKREYAINNKIGLLEIWYNDDITEIDELFR